MLVATNIGIMQNIPENLLRQIEMEARQRAEWSWVDIMIAFKEIGYDPTINEKERIINELSIKKARGMLRKAGY